MTDVADQINQLARTVRAIGYTAVGARLKQLAKEWRKHNDHNQHPRR